MTAHPENEASSNPLELNYEELKESRARVDSIASAVFLVAGGALSLSITVIVGNSTPRVLPKSVLALTQSAWWELLFSIVIFLLLKVYLVFLAYILQFHEKFAKEHNTIFNYTAWAIGLVGFLPFVYGLCCMVRAAIAIVSV
jgi:hypothetical protein